MFGPYTLIFPAGITSILLNISITNDRILEINETFVLSINPDSGVTLADPSSTTVTIVDDDSEEIDIKLLFMYIKLSTNDCITSLNTFS